LSTIVRSWANSLRSIAENDMLLELLIFQQPRLPYETRAKTGEHRISNAPNAGLGEDAAEAAPGIESKKKKGK
jgi:hypothetical protein